MPGPLAGLRIVDCSSGTAGPRASGILADCGAEVIWIERPGGDPHRELLATHYSVFNRGKRSLQVDLNDENQRARLHALIGRADVFMHSWRPGVAERHGLGYADLHTDLPGIIHASISGFGVDGPLRDVPGYEALVHAVVGTMGEQVGYRSGPVYEGLPFASIGAAYLTAIGILGALYRRAVDGIGRNVETSLLDGALAYLSMNWADDDLGSPPHVPGQRRMMVRTVQCADGEYLGVHTGAAGAFDRLMERLGFAEDFQLEPGQLSMAVELTTAQQRIMNEDVLTAFAQIPRSEALRELLSADVCAIPELRACEVFDEQQAQHNRMVIRMDDPVLGEVEQVAPPVRFAATPHADPTAAPVPGQHDDTLADLLEGTPWLDPATEAIDSEHQPLLAGVKVLDFGAFFAAPFATRLLADLGADVIKFEPLGGDQMRGLARAFGSAQRGKRGIALDLKDSSAQPLGQQLAKWADVICHNMRPGAAERLGVGYADVRAFNSDVIYTYAPGWGSSGPDRMRQSFAPLLSGYVGANYEVAGQFNPPLFTAGNEDPGAGLVGAAATLMALVHRQRTGVGQFVEAPQLNAAMVHMAHVVRDADGLVLGAERLDPLQAGVHALDRLYETRDGWVCLVAYTDSEIDGVSKFIGVDITSDSRFATADARSRHDDELFHLIATPLGELSTREVMAALTGAGVPAAVPVPRNDSTFLRNPENHRSGRVAESVDPVRGHWRELAHFVRVSDTIVPANRPAPALGEHTDEILQMLGCSIDEISELRRCSVAK